MFVVDPARAASEMLRVLRPGGSLAVAVWGDRDGNPWLGVVFDAVGEVMGSPMPHPGVPSPFSLGAGDDLVDALHDAGIATASVSRLPVPLRAASFDDWWARTTALAGPLSNILAAQGDGFAESVEAAARRAVRPYETPDGLAFPGVALLAAARKSG